MEQPTQQRYVLYTKDYKSFELRSQIAPPILIQGAKSVAKCLPGDEVSYSPSTGVSLLSRSKHPTLAGLLELNSKVKYGFTSRGSPIYLFTPFNEAYPPFVVGCSERDTSVNRLGLIQFESWSETFPRGNLLRLLPVGADEEALAWTYSPLACERYKGPIPLAPLMTNRQQLPENTFHIDPPGCRDVDDVLTIEHNGSETYIIITIADVAAVVHPGTPLDQRAAQIAQTLYQDGNAPRHMLPAELSESLLSLLPGGEPKPGVSLRFPLSNPNHTEWFLSAVSTSKTYTYESVYTNREITSVLTQMATALGEPTDDSHKWIEVAMKFYNLEAAKLLRSTGQGYLRAHDAPQQTKLNHYTSISPDLRFLAFVSASYIPASATETQHWGLSTDLYTHITSPIRRYADLVNQRVLKAVISQLPLPTSTPPPTHLNSRAKQLKQHDRDLVLLRQIKQQPTGTTQATVIELKPLPETNETKVILYVPAWQLVVRLRYTQQADGSLLSKDERQQFIVKVGDQLTLAYTSNLTARSWKKRMVLTLAE